MTKISSYAAVTPVGTDLLIGTDTSASDATKNFTVSSIAAFIGGQMDATQVLNAASYSDQVPSGLDVALQVNFGAAQGTSSDPVMVSAAGLVTFNQTGLYLVNGMGNVERTGSGGVATLLFRPLVNGTPVGVVKGFDIGTGQSMMPYEITIPFYVSVAGTTFTFEILRDSSGVDDGGLYDHVTASSWDNVPSANLQIWKIGV
jgi:hypothetical protein